MFTKILSTLRQQYLGALALFIVLGGTSYAAATGSIGSREIKNNTILSKDIRSGQVRGGDIRSGAVRTSDVGNGSLLSEDFRSGQLPAGPTNVVVRSNTANAPFTAAVCLPGEVAVGGGGEAPGDNDAVLSRSAPLPDGAGVRPTGWSVGAIDFETGAGASSVTAYVLCASP